MNMFNFMETFFFISLGITFILILLLVYHFKQRILAVEQKGDTLFEIINNLIMETSTLKQYIRSLPMFFNRGGPVESPQNTVIMHQHRPVQPDQDEDEDDEEEEDEEDDEEDEEYDEDEEDVEEDDEPNPKIVVSDDEYGSNIEMEINEMSEFLATMKDNQALEEEQEEIGALNLDELELQEDMVEEAETNVEMEDVEEIENVEETVSEIKSEKLQNTSSVNEDDTTKKTVDLGIVPDYRKMSLSELKTAVLAKSLAQDVSKMKKNQLLQLLGM